MCISNKTKESLISQEYLKFLFDYDAETGNLIWRVSQGRCCSGQIAGNLNNTGYRQIRIDGKLFQAHRLVWLYHYGTWPSQLIDHINRQRDDNRIQNLREVSTQENLRHTKIQSNNSSGQAGVYWNKARGKWHAQIYVNSKKNHLGYFHDFDQALSTRKQAELKYNFSPYHGNTAPLPNVVQL